MATSSKSASRSPQKFGPQAEPEEEVVPVKKSRKKIWVLLIIVLLLAGGAGGAWYFFFSEDDPDKPAPVKTVPPVFVAMESFTVNLQPDPQDHFLQVGVTLQVTTKEEVEMMKLHMPQIRSRLLMLLSSKKSSEISTVEGKNKLAQEILQQVNLPFSPQGQPQNVTNVFFTSFVIQ